MKIFLLNVALAALWMLLERDISLPALFSGFALGFALLALLRPIEGSHDYVRRVFRILVFIGIFLREYAVGAAKTLWISLFRPVSRLQPGLIRYDTGDLSAGELFCLAQSVSLTPGTLTVDVSPDRSHLLIHVLDCRHPQGVRDSIDGSLRRGILAITRP